MRRNHRSILALLALCACSREQPLAPPPLVRVDVTPQFGEVEKQDPEASLPPWRREHGLVLGDCRSAHAFQPGAELLLPVPAGASRLATACAARLRPGAARTGSAKLTLEVLQSEGWKRIGAWEGPLSRLLETWTELELPLPSPAGAAGRVRVRGETTDAPQPDAIELLVEPLRAAAEDGGARQEAGPPGSDGKSALPRDAPTRPGASAARTGAQTPNVLVISIDTLRADHLSCYGYSRTTSPRIDALAKEGVLFTKVVAPAPWTLPSYGSLFTACTPAVHRAGVNGAREERFGRDEDSKSEELEILRSDLPTLAERLAARGWATAGFQANSFLRAKNGLDRGFDRWVFYQYHVNAGVDLALRWIEGRRGSPWFCFLHVMDVHQPYVPPSPFDRKFSDRGWSSVAGYPPPIDELRAKRPDDATVRLLLDEYDGAIAYTDSEVGRLLDRLESEGELDRTLVVVHSDHGEEFWEHGGYEHGHAQHDELLSVPLILRLPGRIPAGRRVDARVRLLDLMPTVLDLLRLEPATGIEGKSLAPLIDGKPESPRECISEATLHGLREIKALTIGSDRLTLSGAGPGRFFDLAQDPSESRDQTADRRARAGELAERLLRRHDVILQSAVRARAMQLTDAERRRLREMGYTEGLEPR